MGFLSDAYLAGILNLASSILVFLPAVIIIWCYRVKQFEEHPYLSCSFVLWALQWFALIVVWALYSPLRFHHVVGVLPRVQSVGVLSAADLSVVAAMGFYWVYAKAEEFRWQEAVRNLAGLYAFLLLWNVLFSPLAPNERLNWLWILPSEILSIITAGLIAATFWFRFGASALPLSAVMIPIYAFLQMPTYASLLQEGKPDDGAWMTGLALAKLAYGLLFYTLFFSQARTHGPAKLPKPSFSIPVHDLLKLAASSAGAALFSLLATDGAHWLGRDGAHWLGHVLSSWLPG